MAISRGFAAFARRMRVIAAAVEHNAGNAVRRAAIAADSTAVLATPVDTGRARGNWRVSIGSPVFEFDPTDTDPGGGSTIAEGQQVIEGSNGQDTIFITNSVPYILPLDQGSSAQAPNGMSSLAVQAAQQQLQGGAAILLDGI